jgi:pilus assembly protein Flp/PilA
MRTNFASLVKRFARDERGATLVEYSVLIALVTVALVAAITLMGDQIQIAFNRIATVLTTSNAP